MRSGMTQTNGSPEFPGRFRPQEENDMLWINEGFVLDDAGNLMMTSYIDLRDKDNRTVIPSLVKGCRREHAIEDERDSAHLEASAFPRVWCVIDSGRAGGVCKGRDCDGYSGDADRGGRAARNCGPE